MDESKVINERCGSLDLDNIDIDSDLDINSPTINIDVHNDSLLTIMQYNFLEEPIPDTTIEEPVVEEPISDAPIEEPVVEEPIPDAPIEEPVVENASTIVEFVLETNNEIDEIKKQIEITQEIAQETTSESISNQETLGDSILESISNLSISKSSNSPSSNSLPITILNNLENNIINIIESCITDKKDTMENTDYMNKVINESNLNYDNKISIENNDVKREVERFIIPDPEIIELDKIIQHNIIPVRNKDLENNLIHKSNVSFSSTDLQEIINFEHLNANNNLENNSSLNTNSEFSYTKKIKNTNHPNLVSKPLYKDIRLNNPICNSNNSKKKQKKQVELDEVDYLYNKLQDYSRNLTINISNYMIIITKAIEIIENYDDFTPSTGHSKKDVVIKAINRLVMIDLELNESDKRVFLSTLSNFIELIIMCSKRHLKDSSTSTKDNFNYKNDKIDDMILATCGQVVFSLIDKLTTIIIKNQYNAEKITHNIPTITEILMLMADKYDYLTGFEKKNIVFQAMNLFIVDKLEHIIDLEQDKKKEIIEILQCVPNTIDLFIALQKQKYKINKKRIIKVKQSGCLTSIFATKKLYEDY